MQNNMKKGFTLVELLVVIAIIGILATLGLVQYEASLAKSRDKIRLGRLSNLQKVLDNNFFNEYYAFPLAAAGQNPSEFESASGVDNRTAGDFTQSQPVCSNRLPKNNTPDTNYIFKWFGKYFVNLSDDTKKDYQQFMNDFGGDVENEHIAGGVIYKGVFKDGRFQYEIAMPLEQESADARMDKGSLWDRFMEIWELVGTDDRIKWADLGCMQMDGSWDLPYKIKKGTDA